MLPEHYTHAVEQPTQQEISRVDGVFIRQVTIPRAGTYVPQHSHVFPHATLLTTGAMRVWAADKLLGDFTAPHVLHIAAGVKHTMLALTNGVVFFCVHNTARTGEVQELERHEFAPDA